MRRRGGARVAAVAACCLVLTACTASRVPDDRAAAACVPDVVAATRAIVRAGDPVELSAQAAPCRLGLTEGGLLTLAMTPADGAGASEVRLGTVRAAPSGAFRTTVRVPEGTAPGDWSVRVAEGLPPARCDDTGTGLGSTGFALASCAAPEAAVRVAPADEDWTSGADGRTAVAVAARIRRGLAGLPGFLAVEVLPGGVQVSSAPPFRDRVDRVVAAAGGRQPAAAEGRVPDGLVPVVRFASRSGRVELTALRARGLLVAELAFDLMTGTVTARVEGLDDDGARVLSRRYGTALVPRRAEQVAGCADVGPCPTVAP